MQTVKVGRMIKKLSLLLGSGSNGTQHRRTSAGVRQRGGRNQPLPAIKAQVVYRSAVYFGEASFLFFKDAVRQRHHRFALEGLHVGMEVLRKLASLDFETVDQVVIIVVEWNKNALSETVRNSPQQTHTTQQYFSIHQVHLERMEAWPTKQERPAQRVPNNYASG